MPTSQLSRALAELRAQLKTGKTRKGRPLEPEEIAPLEQKRDQLVAQMRDQRQERFIARIQGQVSEQAERTIGGITKAAHQCIVEELDKRVGPPPARDLDEALAERRRINRRVKELRTEEKKARRPPEAAAEAAAHEDATPALANTRNEDSAMSLDEHAVTERARGPAELTHSDSAMSSNERAVTEHARGLAELTHSHSADGALMSRAASGKRLPDESAQCAHEQSCRANGICKRRKVVSTRSQAHESFHWLQAAKQVDRQHQSDLENLRAETEALEELRQAAERQDEERKCKREEAREEVRRALGPMCSQCGGCRNKGVWAIDADAMCPQHTREYAEALRRLDPPLYESSDALITCARAQLADVNDALQECTRRARQVEEPEREALLRRHETLLQLKRVRVSVLAAHEGCYF